MTVVVVITSFSIIVSCMLISLLLVTVGIMYNIAGNITTVVHLLVWIINRTKCTMH
jgi:hypothetical protein